MNTCQCNEAGAGMACVGQKRQGSGFRVFVTKSACFEMEGADVEEQTQGRIGQSERAMNDDGIAGGSAVTGRLLHWMWSRMMQCWPQRIKNEVFNLTILFMTLLSEVGVNVPLKPNLSRGTNSILFYCHYSDISQQSRWSLELRNLVSNSWQLLSRKAPNESVQGFNDPTRLMCNEISVLWCLGIWFSQTLPTSMWKPLDLQLKTDWLTQWCS